MLGAELTQADKYVQVDPFMSRSHGGLSSTNRLRPKAATGGGQLTAKSGHPPPPAINISRVKNVDSALKSSFHSAGIHGVVAAQTRYLRRRNAIPSLPSLPTEFANKLRPAEEPRMILPTLEDVVELAKNGALLEAVFSDRCQCRYQHFDANQIRPWALGH